MRAPQGYAVIVDPTVATGHRVQEFDTCTCAHCQAMILVKPGTGSRVYLLPITHPPTPGIYTEAPGASCYRCGMAPVCLTCHAQGTCLPFERWLEEVEKGIRDPASPAVEL